MVDDAQMTSSRENVQVVVRLRPITSKELERNDTPIVRAEEKNSELHLPLSQKRTAQCKTYTFDHVFGPTSTQQQLFESVCNPIVEEVLEGYNCTIFAYGQTGTGKTYTMEGTTKAKKALHFNAGVIPRSIKAIFEYLNKNAEEFTVQVSHLELYNEALTDLLSSSEKDENLKIYEDATKGTYVSSLTEMAVEREEDIFSVLEMSSKKRKTAETLMNKASSRSHSIFTITIHLRKSGDGGDGMLRVGKLNLVDLAGAENISRSGAVGVRSREAGNINQSLLTLGRVISALVDGQPHIPYRDSKLTRLLQESLGGKNKTLIIATCSPAGADLEETNSTIEYAYRAKKIKNRPAVNMMVSKKEKLSELVKENSRLRKELDAMRSKEGVYLPTEHYNALLAKEETQNYMQNLVQETTQLYEKTLSAMEKAEEDKIAAEDTCQNATTRLQAIEGQISGLQEERDQQLKIAQFRRNNEEVISAALTQAKAVVDEAERETVTLRSVIDRKQSLEEMNRVIAGKLEEAVTKGIEEFQAQFHELAEKQNRDSMVARKEMDNFTTAHTKGVHSMATELQALWKSVEECITSSKDQMSSFSNETEKMRQTVHAKVLENGRDSKENLDSFVTKMKTALSALSDQMRESMEAVMTFRDASQLRRETELVSVSSSFDRILAHMKSLDSIVKGEMEKQKSVLMLLDTELERTMTSRNQIARNMKETLMKKLQSATENVYDSVSKNVGQCMQQTRDGTSSASASLVMWKDSLTVLLETINSTSTETFSQVNAAAMLGAEGTSNLLKQANKGVEEISGAVAASSKAVATSIGAVENVVGGAMQSLPAGVAAVNDATRHVRAGVEIETGNIEKALETEANTVKRLAEEAECGHLEFADGAEVVFSGLREYLKQSESYLVDHCRREEKAEGSLNQGFHLTESKGWTPKRRKWSVPEALVKTEEHEQLLELFNKPQEKDQPVIMVEEIRSEEDSVGSQITFEEKENSSINDENRETEVVQVMAKPQPVSAIPQLAKRTRKTKVESRIPRPRGYRE